MRWIDDDLYVMQAGRTVTAGFMLSSPSGDHTMSFMPDGKLFVFHNATR